MGDGAPWKRPLQAVLTELGATAKGLDGAEAARRLAIYGRNAALDHRRTPLWREVLVRFANPLVLILLFAGALSAWTGEVASFVIILVIVVLSIVLELFQQRRAEGAVDALRRSVALRAEVLRDGAVRQVPVEELVPGDIVKLAAGDIVPADCRVLAARDLYVNQAIMTGESYPSEKHAGDLPEVADQPADAVNWLFMGTSVISGTGSALVCRTGRSTDLGELAQTLADARGADAFEAGIRSFGYLILRMTVFLVLFVLVVNVIYHRPWLESLLFALALAVGLTPELLPMVVTVTLANGARRLAGKRAIVKRLPAIHNLGAMDVLCTDKTGTLTESRIDLQRHVDPQGRDSARVLDLALINSAFESGIKSPLDEAVLARGAPDARWSKIDEVPFDFERRRVSVLADDGATRLLVVKGAPEDILALSTRLDDVDGAAHIIDAQARARLQAMIDRFGNDGLRVLAVAYRQMPRDQVSAAASDEGELTLAGFLAFRDPPKRDAAEAIAALARSGVAVKILTGDSAEITRHICSEIGVPVIGVVTGQELAAMSAEALLARVDNVTIFARVTPQQKERVLSVLKRKGKVVGFLGDGINDASALHAADVGISVDSAADVAKQAADIVLLDHDLAVVHEGVLEGRRTVENVTKYILMGASSNLGNMFSMAGAALMLPFLPMLPIQVLLNNLLYDVSETGVPFDDVDPEALRKPVRWDLKFIQRFILVLGPVSSLFDFLTFYALIQLFDASEKVFQTGWFIESLATQSLVIFVIRTRALPWRRWPHPLLASLSVGVVVVGILVAVTPLGRLFGFVPPPAAFYLFLVAATAGYLALVSLVKRAYIYAVADGDAVGERAWQASRS